MGTNTNTTAAGKDADTDTTRRLRLYSPNALHPRSRHGRGRAADNRQAAAPVAALAQLLAVPAAALARKGRPSPPERPHTLGADAQKPPPRCAGDPRARRHHLDSHEQRAVA